MNLAKANTTKFYQFSIKIGKLGAKISQLHEKAKLFQNKKPSSFKNIFSLWQIRKLVKFAHTFML
jgi:hypothetical protein